MKKLFAALLVLALSTPTFAGNAFFPQTGIFYLEEVHCNANPFKTYINVLDSEKRQLGYYGDTFLSWNSDLYLWNASDKEVLHTDIQSALKIRKTIKIYDATGGLVGYAQEELLTSILNKVGAAIAGAVVSNELEYNVNIASPFRRYAIYDTREKLVGVTRKVELGGATIEFWDASETTLIARATKDLADTAGGYFCQNALWKIQLFDTGANSPATDPMVIATIVANKARVDIDASAGKKWEVISNILKSFTPENDKEETEKEL